MKCKAPASGPYTAVLHDKGGKLLVDRHRVEARVNGEFGVFGRTGYETDLVPKLSAQALALVTRLDKELGDACRVPECDETCRVLGAVCDDVDPRRFGNVVGHPGLTRCSEERLSSGANRYRQEVVAQRVSERTDVWCVCGRGTAG
jgi:hypothetical protein